MMASRMLVTGVELHGSQGGGAGPARERARTHKRFREVLRDGESKAATSGSCAGALDNRWKVIIVPSTILVAGSIALIPLKVIQTEFLPRFRPEQARGGPRPGPRGGLPADRRQDEDRGAAPALPARGQERRFPRSAANTAVSTSEIIVQAQGQVRAEKEPVRAGARAARMGTRAARGGLLRHGAGHHLAHLHRGSQAAHHERDGTEPRRSARPCAAGGGRGALRARHGRRGQHDARHPDGGQRASWTGLPPPTTGSPRTTSPRVLRTALAGTERGSLSPRRATSTTWWCATGKTRSARPWTWGRLKVTNRLGQQIPLSQVARIAADRQPAGGSAAKQAERGHHLREHPGAGRWEPSPPTSRRTWQT